MFKHLRAVILEILNSYSCILLTNLKLCSENTSVHIMERKNIVLKFSSAII